MSPFLSRKEPFCVVDLCRKLSLSGLETLVFTGKSSWPPRPRSWGAGAPGSILGPGLEGTAIAAGPRARTCAVLATCVLGSQACAQSAAGATGPVGLQGWVTKAPRGRRPGLRLQLPWGVTWELARDQVLDPPHLPGLPPRGRSHPGQQETRFPCFSFSLEDRKEIPKAG